MPDFQEINGKQYIKHTVGSDIYYSPESDELNQLRLFKLKSGNLKEIHFEIVTIQGKTYYKFENKLHLKIKDRFIEVHKSSRGIKGLGDAIETKLSPADKFEIYQEGGLRSGQISFAMRASNQLEKINNQLKTIPLLSFYDKCVSREDLKKSHYKVYITLNNKGEPQWTPFHEGRPKVLSISHRKPKIFSRDSGTEAETETETKTEKKTVRENFFAKVTDDVLKKKYKKIQDSTAEKKRIYQQRKLEPIIVILILVGTPPNARFKVEFADDDVTLNETEQAKKEAEQIKKEQETRDKKEEELAFPKYAVLEDDVVSLQDDDEDDFIEIDSDDEQKKEVVSTLQDDVVSLQDDDEDDFIEIASDDEQKKEVVSTPQDDVVSLQDDKDSYREQSNNLTSVSTQSTAVKTNDLVQKTSKIKKPFILRDFLANFLAKLFSFIYTSNSPEALPSSSAQPTLQQQPSKSAHLQQRANKNKPAKISKKPSQVLQVETNLFARRYHPKPEVNYYTRHLEIPPRKKQKQ